MFLCRHLLANRSLHMLLNRTGVTAISLCVLLQDKELLAGRSALLAAQRAVAERSAAVTSAKQELWEAKRKMAHQSALLEAVARDVACVSAP
jgi:hypothetical protein